VPYPEDSHVSTVHVDDVARACQFALEQGLTGIYNLVDDNRDSRAEFYGKWLRRRGMPEPRWAPKGGVPTLITNDKIKAAGFAFEHPDADLEDPLRQAAGG
jgi:nucleoside-diphosphate-sugar epimerase